MNYENSNIDINEEEILGSDVEVHTEETSENTEEEDLGNILDD